MDFLALQRAFAAHLRDPDNVPPPPGIEPRRMGVYRELFFNNVHDLLSGTFPVCRDVLGQDGWSRLVRRFYAGHKAHTPYFLELPREFVDWLATAGAEPPFLAELAHYEWVELALSIAGDGEPDDGIDPDGDLLAGQPVVSPLAWLLAYRWPVHRLSAAFQPAEVPAEPTFVIVYRPAGDGVRFLQVDAPTARLVELLEAGDLPNGRAAVQCAAGRAPTDPAALPPQAVAMLRSLRERSILLGTRRPGAGRP